MGRAQDAKSRRKYVGAAMEEGRRIQKLKSLRQDAPLCNFADD